jgi:hypothetical protein
MNEEFTAKQSPVEELTMPTTDLNPSPVAPQTEDWGMTNPLKKPSDGMKNDGWRMPEPVFRVSDGFCPLKSDGKIKSGGKSPESLTAPKQPADESLANLYAPPEKETEADFSQHTMHNLSLSDLNLPVPELAPAAPKTVAAPQPNISEEFVVKPKPTEMPIEKKQHSETARLFFVALGVLVMLSFAAGFLALVYFLFFYKSAG